MSLQKYQWGFTGMRQDNSEGGAMHYYRGMETDAYIAKVEGERDEMLKWFQDNSALLATHRIGGFHFDTNGDLTYE